MSFYSIDQFSQITGLNKILIRTWENRYNFLTPKRSSTNIRTYDDEMLNKGIKYSLLVENGFKISKLVNLKNKDLNNLLEKTLEKSKDNNVKYNIYISRFLEAALTFNQEIFEKTYNTCLNKLGIINFYKEILIKTMQKISILYLNNEITSANEHFLSENIRIKLANEINKIKSNTENSKKWILFLPENEYHDIGLLFTYLLLKKYNQNVIYLGQNNTRKSLLKINNNNNNNFLFFLNTKRTKEFSERLCQFLNVNLSKSKIYVIENEQLIMKKYNNIISLKSIDNFINKIEIK